MEELENIISVEETQPPMEALRKEANIQGAALLIYHILMNVVLGLVMFVAAFAAAFSLAFSDPNAEILTEDLIDQMMGVAGWGYVAAVAIGFVILLLWKKPAYIRHTIGQKGKPMGVGSFFVLLSLTMSAQLVAQIVCLGLEELLELLHMDPAILDELTGMDTNSLPMLVYMGILAPITEELLFRGLLLRSIAPYGKKLAIIGSAILFGLYHANPIQIPYAMLVGLVLGYTALEYNVLWAIGLHMFNNLGFALLLPMALSPLPAQVVDWVMWAVVIGFFIAAVLILIAKRARIAADWKQERIERWQRQGFFGAPVMVVLIVLLLVSTVATMVMLML